MSANIPLYGQNKEGGALGLIGDSLKVFRMDISVTDSGNANNADTGFDMPANFVPLWSVSTNSGSTDLAGNACALDVGGTDIIADVNALAAGASVQLGLGGNGMVASATNVLIDGSSGLVTASGSTTLTVEIVGFDSGAGDPSDLQLI